MGVLLQAEQKIIKGRIKYKKLKKGYDDCYQHLTHVAQIFFFFAREHLKRLPVEPVVQPGSL